MNHARSILGFTWALLLMAGCGGAPPGEDDTGGAANADDAGAEDGASIAASGVASEGQASTAAADQTYTGRFNVVSDLVDNSWPGPLYPTQYQVKVCFHVTDHTNTIWTTWDLELDAGDGQRLWQTGKTGLYPNLNPCSGWITWQGHVRPRVTVWGDFGARVTGNYDIWTKPCPGHECGTVCCPSTMSCSACLK
jgi:hypothetical protein